jgi:hypothetical protein
MATTAVNPSIQLASQDVGLIFVREYYTFLNKKPHRLHAFYNKDSLFVRGDEGSVTTIVKGQEVSVVSMTCKLSRLSKTI